MYYTNNCNHGIFQFFLKGKEGNFYYWDEVTPEVVKKSKYTLTKERLRLTPDDDEWFRYNEKNYKETVNIAFKKIVGNLNYFDGK